MAKLTEGKVEEKGKENILRLRAHHLLCLQGFQGYGYSEEFVENISRILRALRENPWGKILLVRGGDEVCEYCPYEKDGRCEKTPDSERKVQEMDEKVFLRTGTRPGTLIKAEDIKRLIDSSFTQFSHTEEICGDCSWKEKCRWYILSLEKK